MSRQQKNIFSTIIRRVGFIVALILSFWLGMNVQWLQQWYGVDSLAKKSNAPITETLLPPEEGFNMQEIWDVWDVLQQKMYVENKLPSTDAVYGMIKGLVDSIGDQHTVFLDPSETTDFHIAVDGEVSGIGAEIAVRGKEYYIADVLKNTPAFLSGVKPEDIITRVDNQKTDDMKYRDIVNAIRGPQRTEVVLEVFRPSLGESLTFHIIRDNITVPTVTFEMLDEGIGYVELSQFGPKTYTDMKAALEDLVSQGMKSLILDVRDNGGGYLDQAVHIVSSFIPYGNVIQTEYADGTRETLPVDGKVLISEDIPMVVLINEYSASASEITAGTLQDYKRATLVGVTSFGKGTVQTTVDFQDGSLLKYTISKWLTGEGHDINKKGVLPDIEIEMTHEEGVDTDPQLDKAKEILLQK